MARRLPLAAVALLLLLGAACGTKAPLPRYVYYPSGSAPTAHADPSGYSPELAATDAQDDPTPLDYVDARPAATGATTAAPAPAPSLAGLPHGAIGRVEIPKTGVSQPI